MLTSFNCAVHQEASPGVLYNAPVFNDTAGGDKISGVDLRRGLFRRSQSDEDLGQTITRGAPGGMPAFKLEPADLTGIVAFIRAGFDTSASIRVGDAARGRAVFQGKGECGACHRVAGRGPRSAPDLSDIGVARPRRARTLRSATPRRRCSDQPAGADPERDGRTILGRR